MNLNLTCSELKIIRLNLIIPCPPHSSKLYKSLWYLLLPRVDGRPFSKDFLKLCRKIILFKVVVLNLDYIFELLEKLKTKKKCQGLTIWFYYAAKVGKHLVCFYPQQGHYSFAVALYYSHITSHRRGHGNPLQYSCLENPHGQKSLVGYSPWDHKVRHDWPTKHTHTHMHAHTQLQIRGSLGYRMSVKN